MHELTMAINLKTMIERAVAKNSCTKVNKIVISLGEFSNIYKDALEFSLDVVKKDSVFSEAEIQINMIKTILKCSGCGQEFSPKDFVFICPACSSAGVTILQGEGMTLDTIEAE